MAFLQNWRVRHAQQMKWAGWAFLAVSCLNHGPYRKQQVFLLSPDQASPAFSLLLTLIPAALWAFLCLSSLSIPVPSCTHVHTRRYTPCTCTYTHTHTKPLEHSPAEHLQGWVTALWTSRPLCISKLSLLGLPPSQTLKQSCWTHPRFYFSPPHFPTRKPF